MTWPANIEQRSNSFRRGGYDTGDVCDGHRLMRYVEDDKTCIDIEHPPTCAVGGEGMLTHYACPWGEIASESCEDLRELYAGDGGDADRALPLEEEITVTWRCTSWQSWTDYGWEGDGSFSWWVDDTPVSRSTEAPTQGQEREAS